ncbi:MAG: DUF2520 domain-containing protein [Tannerellaceae bacterium]|jgi:predicted short-subunit dehydrogenase-like oxidoreductase (DUF2520 family)|nr:DUF2520 domain-containing protein [Tannerellaceae bacterium]
MKIVFIGAGNLASSVSLEMQRVGMTIVQVFSLTAPHAEDLARRLNCGWTTSTDGITGDADLYIFAVPDGALTGVINSVKPNGGLWVHTSGSMPMSVFEGHAARYGAFYPVQTFTRGRRVELDGAPIFLETADPSDMVMLRKIAIALTGNAREADSVMRRHIHLAAVFACNFSNHMYAVAARLLEREGLSYDVLLPLIGETAAKVKSLPPLDAQTGPASRGDNDVMEAHLDMLEGDKEIRAIYKVISDNILKNIQE